MTIKNMAMILVISTMMATLPARAQFAPGSTAIDTLPTVTDAMPSMEGQDNSGMARIETTKNGLNATDSCPEPKKALARTPDDLAKIQEDITRFTLCVQRAQLLERLNALAESNIETIDSALNLTVNQTESGNAVPGIMPSFPVPQMSESAAQMLVDDEPDYYAPTPSASVPYASEWRIRDIRGKGGQITAQLVNDQGVYLKVMQGETLPDNGGEIATLTNTSVRVRKNGETQSLKWVE